MGKQIVIVWSDMNGYRETGKWERFDGVNWKPTVEACRTVRAAMWLNDGGDDDVDKARDYIHKSIQPDHPDARVVVLHEQAQDPLKKAKDIFSSLSAV